MAIQEKNGELQLLSRLTQLMVVILAGLGISGTALAQGKIDRATQEHQQALRQLKEAHQNLFGNMDRYFEAVSSKKPDPAKVAAAKREMGETNQKIDGILGDAHSRMNTLIQSMTYSLKDGLQEKTAEDEQLGEPLPASQVSSFLASNPPVAKDPEAASGKATAVTTEMGSPAGGRPSPRPSPSPQMAQPSSPEILDAQAPREFVFKKRGDSSGAAAPTPPTPTPRGN